jgi:prepilin-type N-terminal cleavage/methylation domain-containing protein
MKKKFSRTRSAFTLTELVATVVIIGFLSAIMIPKVMTGINKSRVAAIVTDTRNIRNAAYAMYADTGLWPGSNWANDSDANAGGDPLAPANAGEGFTYKGNNVNMPDTWAGPYLEAWHRNPWGGWYWWDFNLQDQNNDGIGYEHVLWLDNIYSNTNNRIPNNMRLLIDLTLDDGNLSTGMMQVWQIDPVNNPPGNLGYILIQGFN